jgi:succinyl-diaminopimelate desuccinylase
VGEPTAEHESGDVIKNGRRGSLSATLRVHGKQGHVAYPHLARNPVHRFASALAELVGTEWDRGNAHFPATTLQVSNIHAGTGANNVIPGALEVLFNFRFSTEVTEAGLRERVAEILERHGVDYDIQWTLSGEPYLTPPGRLVKAAQRAIRHTTGKDARLSTDGGTSDGRFIAPTGSEVVEVGPCNATIHQVDECIEVGEARRLHDIYLSLLENLLGH